MTRAASFIIVGWKPGGGGEGGQNQETYLSCANPPFHYMLHTSLYKNGGVGWERSKDQRMGRLHERAELIQKQVGKRTSKNKGGTQQDTLR